MKTVFATSRDGTKIHVCSAGSENAPTLVFAHGLGCNLHLWDDVVALLPADLRIIRYDLRGHGRSDVPAGDYSMGQLVSDAEAVCDRLEAQDVVFVGHAVGGMVAQGLAVKRPELARALVLSNTAAKIGDKSAWDRHIADARAKGMAGIADDLLPRWLGRDFLMSAHTAQLRAMLIHTRVDGYAGVAAAIAGTDFYTPTSGLRIPTLGIAGFNDGVTPPDLVRETVDLIPGSQFTLMRRTGHLPCLDQPQAYADHLTSFLQAIGHI